MGMFSNPFKGNPFKRVGRAVGTAWKDTGRELKNANTTLGNWMTRQGWKSDARLSTEEANQASAIQRAAHDAEVAQLAEGALGAVGLRRRRGMSATMLTGTGASPSSTGKTMLGQ